MENKVDSVQTLLDAAVAIGVIACPTEPSGDGNTFAQVAPRIKFLQKAQRQSDPIFGCCNIDLQASTAANVE
jgi:hypothetical protein